MAAVTNYRLKQHRLGPGKTWIFSEDVRKAKFGIKCKTCHSRRNEKSTKRTSDGITRNNSVSGVVFTHKIFKENLTVWMISFFIINIIFRQPLLHQRMELVVFVK